MASSSSHHRKAEGDIHSAKNFPKLFQLPATAMAAAQFLIASGAVKDRAGERCMGRTRHGDGKNKKPCEKGRLQLEELQGQVGWYSKSCESRTLTAGGRAFCSRMNRKFGIFAGTPFEGFKKPLHEIVTGVYLALIGTQVRNPHPSCVLPSIHAVSRFHASYAPHSTAKCRKCSGGARSRRRSSCTS